MKERKTVTVMNNIYVTPAIEKDRNTNTLELMQRMKLHGMASAFRESLSSIFAESFSYNFCSLSSDSGVYIVKI